jgi:hypothetical protein
MDKLDVPLVVDLLLGLDYKSLTRFCKTNRYIRDVCHENKNFVHYKLLQRDLKYPHAFDSSVNYHKLYKRSYRYTDEYKRFQIGRVTDAYTKLMQKNLSDAAFRELTEKLNTKLQDISKRKVDWAREPVTSLRIE